MFDSEKEEMEHTLILMDIKDHEWEFTCNVNYRPQYQEKCPDCVVSKINKRNNFEGD